MVWLFVAAYIAIGLVVGMLASRCAQKSLGSPKHEAASVFMCSACLWPIAAFLMAWCALCDVVAKRLV